MKDIIRTLDPELIIDTKKGKISSFKIKQKCSPNSGFYGYKKLKKNYDIKTMRD